MARARNRPHRAVAWILVATLSALIALSTQAAAAPGAAATPDDDAAEGDAWLDDRPTDASLGELAAGDDWLDGQELADLAGLAFVPDAIDDLAARGATSLGRLDLSLVWRRRDALTTAPAPFALTTALDRRVDEVWLVAAWSR